MTAARAYDARRGPMYVEASKPDGAPPPSFPALVTGTGWDGDAATVRDLFDVHDAIGTDVLRVIDNDAHAWGNPSEPHGPETLGEWEAWLTREVTDCLMVFGEARLYLFERDRDGVARKVLHSRWTMQEAAR